MSPEPLPRELQLAYRVAMPSTIGLTFGATDAPTPVTATLHTHPDVLPDPKWVQQLWDSVVTHDQPAGVRLIDQQGVCLHAGATTDGRLVGHGDRGDSPFLRTDRADAMLLPPYVAPGSDVPNGNPTGRLIATSVAVALDNRGFAEGTLDDAGFGRRQLDLVNLFDEPILLLDGPAPGCGYPQEQHAVDKAVRRLAEAGFTPIYQWTESTERIDARTAQEWRSAGVVLIPPSPDRYNLSFFRPDPLSPRSDAIVSALQPGVIAHLSLESLEWDFQSIAGMAGDATVIYAGPPSEKSDERADITCSLDDLADTISNAQSRGLSGASDERSRSQIVPIPSVDTEAGLISIVIPVHNRWDLTEVCLAKIAEHTAHHYEIIVVDNGSTDGTAAGLAAAGVTVLTNTDNLGFPTAVNQGIVASQGEFTCVLNNDTEVTRGWADAMLGALALPDTAMVGPRSNRIAGSQRIPEGPAADDPNAHAWAAGWTKGRRGRSWLTGRLIGFCLLLRRSTLEDLGGFDEGFGVGNYEDDELGNRILATGRDLRVVDDAVVIHHGSATFAELGLDYAAVVHESSRNLTHGHSAVSHLTATVVLSDGDSVGAAASAASALAVAEHIRIVERSALISTEMAAAAIRGGQVEVISGDWMSADGAAAALAGIEAPNLLVLGAGELVHCEDMGRARAELEALGDQTAEVVTQGGSEVRIVPPT
ncbi:MAG: glycosyltransferase family 2 protein, partial [Actinomycetota bacterium]|nr:glycosyltransferase family 2 protein [Actinomycetota bacterium]